MTDSSTPYTCPRCHLLIDQTDCFCRHCGRNLKPGKGFLFSHTGIILMSLILGPLALPFAWLSKRISLTSKIIYTVVLTLLGICIGLACYHIYQVTWQAAQELLGNNF